MKRYVRRGLTMVVAVAAMIVAALGSAPMAAAIDPPMGYYLVPWSGDIYYVDGWHATSTKLTYSQWAQAAFPAPKPASPNYTKFGWADTIFATTGVPFVYPNYALTADQWARAGYPAPTVGGVPDVAVTRPYRWETGPELFATFTASRSDGTPVSALGKLSYVDWAWLRTPAPNLKTGGFQKLSWLPVIAQMSNVTLGDGQPVTFDQWQAQAFPTPQVVQDFPGDLTCSFAGTDDLVYFSPVTPDGHTLTFDQWGKLGFPAPQDCTTAAGAAQAKAATKGTRS